MKKLFLIVVAITVLLTINVMASEQDSIIIYSSMEQYRGEELQNQLNEKFPNENILVMYMPTAKAAAKISVEKTDTDADIVLGLESSYMEKISDSLTVLNHQYNLDYVDGLTLADNHNKYLTWERFAGSFVVNIDVLEKYGLAIPQTYEDLLKPEYKGLIAMPDPKSSGTGYFFYLNRVNELKEEGALQYFKDLEQNIKSFTESGSGPMKLLIQGEIAIGMGMTFQAVNEINDGSPFEIIIPPQGSPFSITGAGIIEGKQKNHKVQEIFDYIMEDFFLYDKENFSPEKVLKSQPINIENYPEDIVYADMEGIENIQLKEKLLALWQY